MAGNKIFCLTEKIISDCVKLVSPPTCLYENSCEYVSQDGRNGDDDEMCINHICELFKEPPSDPRWKEWVTPIAAAASFPKWAIGLLVLLAVLIIGGVAYLVYRNGCKCCLDFGSFRIFGQIPGRDVESGLYPQLDKPE